MRKEDIVSSLLAYLIECEVCYLSSPPDFTAPFCKSSEVGSTLSFCIKPPVFRAGLEKFSKSDEIIRQRHFVGYDV